MMQGTKNAVARDAEQGARQSVANAAGNALQGQNQGMGTTAARQGLNQGPLSPTGRTGMPGSGAVTSGVGSGATAGTTLRAAEQAVVGGLPHNHHERAIGNAAMPIKSEITGESEAFCPNPNMTDLPKEFETRVQVIQKFPEMKTIEKTDYVKQVVEETRTIAVPRTRVVMEEHERVDMVPTVKEVPKKRIELVHRVVTEEREVVDMVPTVVEVPVPRKEVIPRVVTDTVEKQVKVPVVREVPVTRQIEVPTGKFCEAPVGTFVNPGNLLQKEVTTTTTTTVGSGAVGAPAVGHRGLATGAAGATVVGAATAAGVHHHNKVSRTSSSSSSSDEEDILTPTGRTAGTGATLSPTAGAGMTRTGKRGKKKSLIKRIEEKIMPSHAA